MFGKVGPNKGKTISNETREKLRKSSTGKPGLIGDKNPMFGKPGSMLGKKMSKESVEKGLKTRRDNYNKLSKEEKTLKKERLAKHIIDITSKFSIDRKTLPERIVEEVLIELNVNYEFQHKVEFYLCDFIIGNKKLIEVQGDYWHVNPEKYKDKILNNTQKNNIRRDKAKNTFLNNRGYSVLYLWENDIKNRKEKVIEEIKIFLNTSRNEDHRNTEGD